MNNDNNVNSNSWIDTHKKSSNLPKNNSIVSRGKDCSPNASGLASKNIN